MWSQNIAILPLGQIKSSTCALETIPSQFLRTHNPKLVSLPVFRRFTFCAKRILTLLMGSDYVRLSPSLQSQASQKNCRLLIPSTFSPTTHSSSHSSLTFISHATETALAKVVVYFQANWYCFTLFFMALYDIWNSFLPWNCCSFGFALHYFGLPLPSLTTQRALHALCLMITTNFYGDLSKRR